MDVPAPQWVPKDVSAARVVRFARWLEKRGIASFDDASDYGQLQSWSAKQPAAFWQAVSDYFEVDFVRRAEATLADARMPGATWFPGAVLNFGHHLLRHGEDDRLAIVLVHETGERESLTFGQLRADAAALAAWLRARGVGPGDRVAAYLPNCVEGVVALAATALIGATWSQTALDYSAEAAADRLAQLRPKVLFTAGGYQHKGQVRDRRDQVQRLRELLPELEHTVAVTTCGLSMPAESEGVSAWAEAVGTAAELRAEPVPFDHPLWVLFTSGTTGRPKGIVHGHGGALMEQLASPGFHLDLGPHDVFFWYTSPNWMMWNAQVCGLLHGATIVLYDGDPTTPSPDALWRTVADLGVTVFGTSPGYLLASARAGVEPGRDLDLAALRIIGVTGSVLPASSNVWVREHVSPSIQVGSMSGGTDVVGVFVASAPTTPVYDGEISAIALGVALEVWDEDGRRLPAGVAGEMVITAPMPSMPLYFWDDPDGKAYQDAYFSVFPGVWRHGDSMTLTERGTVILHGRSDSTLNRSGVRLGSAEIYQAIESMPEVEDSLVVGVEERDGGYWMPLFVVPAPGVDPSARTVELIRTAIARRASARHVPDEIVFVRALPHTRTGKKLEVPVKRILQGADASQVSSAGAVDDPAALQWLADYARERLD